MKRKALILGIAALLTILGQKLPVQELTHPYTPEQPVKEITTNKTIPQFTQTLYPVVRVVDGDTVVVRIDGVDEKIRLIGVNTPETVDPRRTVECFGKEASAFTKKLLENSSVALESDSTQTDRDKYGRFLRYVFLSDGTLVNKKLIEEGYAYEYTYRAPYRYQTEFKIAQREAQENARGLWAPDACLK